MGRPRCWSLERGRGGLGPQGSPWGVPTALGSQTRLPCTVTSAGEVSRRSWAVAIGTGWVAASPGAAPWGLTVSAGGRGVGRGPCLGVLSPGVCRGHRTPRWERCPIVGSALLRSPGTLPQAGGWGVADPRRPGRAAVEERVPGWDSAPGCRVRPLPPHRPGLCVSHSPGTGPGSACAPH